MASLNSNDEELDYYLGSVLTSVSNFRGVSLIARQMEKQYSSAELFERLFTHYSKEYLRIPAARNYAIIVPTKALINDVTNSLAEDLNDDLYEHDFRIVTSVGEVSLEEQHNYIFLMTPERLLYLLILMTEIAIEYLFIDEAHKISKRDSRSAFYYKVVDMLSQ